MKIILQSGLIAFALLILSGCKKENNTTPASTNVNVKATTFSVTSWPYSSPYYYTNLSVPDLTSANLNAAAVMVYFSTGNNAWNALPYTQYNFPSNYFMGFNTSPGNVNVTWVYDSSTSSGNSPNTYYGVTVQIKVVVIPPAIKKQHPDLNLLNYQEVKNRFNIQE